MSDKFTAGDRVKVDNEDDQRHGEKGTVVFVSPGGEGTMVCLDNGLTLEPFRVDELKHFVQPKVRRIIERYELNSFRAAFGLGADWHEPDECDITAEVCGKRFDNAGNWGNGSTSGEMYVILKHDDEPVAEINLATLFAWATGRTS